MMRLFRAAGPSFRALVILVSLAAVCVLGQIPRASFAATAPPPAPDGLNADANANSSITVSWDPTPGATSYNVYRGTSPGGEGATPIASTTATTYKDLNLSSSPIYFYEVTAVNSGGESSRSAEDASRPRRRWGPAATHRACPPATRWFSTARMRGSAGSTGSRH